MEDTVQRLDDWNGYEPIEARKSDLSLLTELLKLQVIMAGQRRKADDALDSAAETTEASRGGVFQLYQTGLGPDQLLQLCYMRRRASRRLRTELSHIEDAFVLPRPALEVASVLPPVDTSLLQLEERALASTTLPQVDTASTTDSANAQAKESARKHFLQPRQAEPENIRKWAVLTESDWLEVYQDRQEDDEMATDTLPSIGDVCWMLHQCPSDALAVFVWDHLLIPLLKQCVRLKSDASTPQKLFTLLVSRRPFASLHPKDFRAKVRARELRQVDDVFGAHAELQLVALYRRQRDGVKC